MSLGGILGSVFGGLGIGNFFESSSAADKAAKAQMAAAQAAQKQAQDQYIQTREDLQPYRDVGAPAVASYADAIGLNGPDKQAAAQANFRTDPGYQFAMDEGTRAVEGSAAARGNLLGGGTLKALTRFGQGTADQQYGSYLDRFLKAANIGQNAAAQTGSFGADASGRIGGYITDAGAAQAGGYLGQAKAFSDLVSNITNAGGYLAGRTGALNNNLSLTAKPTYYEPISTKGYFPMVGPGYR
jgi:hypothetical protein